MGKSVIINGKKKILQLSIDDESVDIYIDNDTVKEQKEPTHVAYWHVEEAIEDGEVAMPMVNAVHLYHTNPQELIDRLMGFGILRK